MSQRVEGASWSSVASMAQGAKPPRAPGALPGLGHLLRFAKNPVALAHAAHAACGEVVELRLPGKSAFLFTGPDAHEFVLTSPASKLGMAEFFRFILPSFYGAGYRYDPAVGFPFAYARLLQPLMTEARLRGYARVVRDRELVAELKASFDLVVLDEAQRIKNSASQTSHAIRALSRRRSWALTGTPVENSADDIVGLFEFVAPGHLDERMSPRALGAAAADHVLRRTKDKVLKDLPPRLNRDERIELTPEQRETYRRAEEDGVLRLAEMGRSATIRHVFELVLRLKQVCNFDTHSGESAKLDCLKADLGEVQASGRKALVFSQWVETLGKLEKELAPFGALQYHGGMSTAARDEAIRRFKTDRRHSVLLLSYGAGAVGLNLQFSQYVFLFDRWWNPAVEDQAINRAHRIGAAGAVTVTRSLAADTIEELIDEVLRKKRDLSELILSQSEPAEAGSTGLTVDELFALFRLPSPSRSAAAA